MVESQPSKLLVAGSSPVSRSFHNYILCGLKVQNQRKDFMIFLAHVAQSVEHFLGKEEVTGSSPVVSSKQGGSL